MLANDYVKNAIRDVETELDNVGKLLPTWVKTSMSPGYRPELDGSRELDLRCASYYMGLIKILRWCVELRRVDIITNTLML